MRRIALIALLGACASTNGKSASFDVRHEVTIKAPAGATTQRAWVTIPQRDPAQRVRSMRVEAPYPYREVKDSEGNRFLYFEVENPDPAWKVTTTFAVTRREQHADPSPAKTRPYTPADLRGKDRYLQANAHVVINDRVRDLAREIVGDEKNPVAMSRRIYDWVLGNVQYWVKWPERLKASKVGSTLYCLDTGTGNCTDFHSLYLSLSRAAGIPTRIVYGSLFKAPLDGKDQDQSYHCWIEFWAPNLGWVPLDVAVADIYVDDFRVHSGNASKVTLTVADGFEGGPDQGKVDYYFGNLDERRVAWNRGRDLILAPGVGPVNAVPKAYVIVDGEEGSFDRKLTYTERE